MQSTKRPRTLDSFFKPPPTKKPKTIDPSSTTNDTTTPTSTHPTYPFPIPHLPTEITDPLNFAPANEPKPIANKPDLDLLYYQPYIPKEASKPLFAFLRSQLPFYRVQYTIKRGGPTGPETLINTPRYTTVFGVDSTSRFDASGTLLESTSGKPVSKEAYKCRPRPLPACLEILKTLTENTTGHKFNFALVNYYATGDDSISYHSDDERFLGALPAIASLTLGAQRDFLMKHKPTERGGESESKPIRFDLRSGEMVLMRGRTQSCWLHSVPKRKGGEVGVGRVNVTFRWAVGRGGTENYYRYNVGEGEVYKWEEGGREMGVWQKEGVEGEGVKTCVGEM